MTRINQFNLYYPGLSLYFKKIRPAGLQQIFFLIQKFNKNRKPRTSFLQIKVFPVESCKTLDVIKEGNILAEFVSNIEFRASKLAFNYI